MIKKILTAIGILALVNGIFLCAVSNFNLGVLMTVLFALFFLFWGIFYDRILEITKHGILKVLKNLILLLVTLEILLVGFIAVYGQFDNVKYNEDAVVVLGAALHGDRISLPLKLRLDTTLEYYEKNPDAVIVVTGGQGLQEAMPEGKAMADYLVKNGVAEDKIIKEEKATSTNENMKYSKEILDGYFEGEYKIAVITNNFHIYRGVTIAENEGFKNVSHMHAGLKWYNMLPCYLRESLAILKMWFIDML